MKARIQSYWPSKFDDDHYTFSFSILPEFSIFWLNGLQNIYLGWLFWELNIMIHPIKK